MRVAVIPARGGSKRVPRKNVRDFAGKPMIAYSIDCALKSEVFDRVIVSTDDDEISRIACQLGAEVPFIRPKELSNDHAGTIEVIAHAIEYLQDQGTQLSAVCCIYATAPFIDLNDLKQGLTIFESGSWQYVFSATSFAYPIFRSFQRDLTGGLSMFFPEHFHTRSQDLPEALHDAGQFYWGRPDAWTSGVRVFDKHSTVVMVPPWRVQDIDTEEDWQRAKLMCSYLTINP